MQSHEKNFAKHINTGLKAFELSQTLPERFVTFNPHKKRQLLQTTCLNLTFDGVSVVPEYRKPFDILAEGLSVQSGRGDSPQSKGNIAPVEIVVKLERWKPRCA